MLPIIEYKKLFEPYSRHITLDRALLWLRQEATKRKISHEIMELAVAQTFLEMADGRKFSKAGCDCGCEFKNHHSALIHFIRQRMIDLTAETLSVYVESLEKILNHSIEMRIALKWRIWKRFFKWEKSPILKGIRWIFLL